MGRFGLVILWVEMMGVTQYEGVPIEECISLSTSCTVFHCRRLISIQLSSSIKGSLVAQGQVAPEVVAPATGSLVSIASHHTGRAGFSIPIFVIGLQERPIGMPDVQLPHVGKIGTIV